MNIRLIASIALLTFGINLGFSQKSVPVKLSGSNASRKVNGTIIGRQYVDHVFAVGAGQTFKVSMKSTGSLSYFNVISPSAPAAMFIGSAEGSSFSRRAPIAGKYSVRVYLMASAGRRNEKSSYTITLSVKGTPLKPLAHSDDAVVPGTNFNAETDVECKIDLMTNVKLAKAYVLRYSHDGSATVEIRAEGLLRRLLFVKGKVVSSDSTEPIKSTVKSDDTVVELGSQERYVIPNALVFGG